VAIFSAGCVAVFDDTI